MTHLPQHQKTRKSFSLLRALQPNHHYDDRPNEARMLRWKVRRTYEHKLNADAAAVRLPHPKETHNPESNEHGERVMKMGSLDAEKDAIR